MSRTRSFSASFLTALEVKRHAELRSPTTPQPQEEPTRTGAEARQSADAQEKRQAAETARIQAEVQTNKANEARRVALEQAKTAETAHREATEKAQNAQNSLKAPDGWKTLAATLGEAAEAWKSVESLSTEVAKAVESAEKETRQAADLWTVAADKAQLAGQTDQANTAGKTAAEQTLQADEAAKEVTEWKAKTEDAAKVAKEQLDRANLETKTYATLRKLAANNLTLMEPFQTVPLGATKEQIGALANLRSQMTKKIEAFVKEPAPIQAVLLEIMGDFKVVKQKFEEIRQDKNRFQAAKKEVESQSSQIHAPVGPLPKDWEPNRLQITALKERANQLVKGQAKNLSVEALDNATKALQEARELVLRVEKKIEEEKLSLANRLAAVKSALNEQDVTLPGAEEYEPYRQEVETLRKTLASDVTKPAETKHVLETEGRLNTLRVKVQAAEKGAAARRQQLKEEMDGIAKKGADDAHTKDPAEATSQHKEDLKQARIRLAEAVQMSSSAANVKAAGERLLELDHVIERVRLDLKKADLKKKFAVGGQSGSALAGDEDVERMCEAFGPDGVETLSADLGGLDAVAQLCAPFPKDRNGLKALKSFASEGLGGTKALQTIYQVGCEGDASKVKDLVETFAGDLTNLNKIFKNGFANRPEMLANVLKIGCAGKAADLKAITDAFIEPSSKNPRDLVKLKGLVEKSGFADKPELLGHLLKGGKATQLRELATTFDSERDLNHLKNLLNKGGLDAAPESLNALFQVGLGASDDPKDAAEKLSALGRELAFPEERLAGLKGLMGDGGLGQESEIFGDLVKNGTDGDPRKMALLCQAFPTPADHKAFGQLLGPGGFAARSSSNQLLVAPDTLTQFFKTGCQNNPVELQKFCTGLGDNDRKNLKSLLVDGGLGQSPEVLGSLYSVGCPAKPGDFKTLAAEFSSAPDLKNLNNVLDNGGLRRDSGSGTYKVKPETLSHLFLTGFGGQAAKLKTLGASLEKDATGNFSALLKEGGLGQDPLVFAEAVKVGCDADPGKLKGLFDGFSLPKQRKDLAQLLSDGGFGTKEPPDPRGSVKSECLGQLLKVGCDKDPARLATLCGGLDDGSRKNLAGLMTAGHFGQEPLILAHLYKTGCDQAPADFKTFCDAYDGTSAAKKPERIKELIQKGGFLRPHPHQDALAKVLKDGLDKDPVRLQKLHSAFSQNSSQPNDLKDLETTIDSFYLNSIYTDPTKHDQPGMRIKNVLTVMGSATDPTPLKATFFDNLKNAAPSNLTRQKELIETAATMECKPFALTNNPVVPGDNVPRMDHYCERHTREYQAFKLLPESDLTAPPVSLWKEGTTQATVATRCSNAVTQWTSNWSSPTYGNLRGWMGPHVNFRQDSVTTGGYTTMLGFELDKPGNGQVWDSQFYPMAGPDVTAITNAEAHAMKRALNK